MEAMSDVNGRLIYGPTKTYERQWVRLPTFLTALLAKQSRECAVRPGRPCLRRFTRSAAALPLVPPGRVERHRRDGRIPERCHPTLPAATCASLLVAAGADPVAVQRHLGHKDVTTTLNIYAGLFPNRLEEIVVALDGIHEAAQGARASVATRG